MGCGSPVRLSIFAGLPLSAPVTFLRYPVRSLSRYEDYKPEFMFWKLALIMFVVVARTLPCS